MAKGTLACLETYLQTIRQQIIYLIHIYKQDLALNDLQRLICSKKTTKQPKIFISTIQLQNFLDISVIFLLVCLGWVGLYFMAYQPLWVI